MAEQAWAEAGKSQAGRKLEGECRVRRSDGQIPIDGAQIVHNKQESLTRRSSICIHALNKVHYASASQDA